MSSHSSLPPGLLRALSDPGSVLPREGGYGIDGDEFESLAHWQARAVLAAGFHYCGCDGFQPSLPSPEVPAVTS